MYRARFLVGFRIRFKRYGFQRGTITESFSVYRFQRSGKCYVFQFHTFLECIPFNRFQLAVLAEIDICQLAAETKCTIFYRFQRAVIAKRNGSERLLSAV